MYQICTNSKKQHARHAMNTGDYDSMHGYGMKARIEGICFEINRLELVL
jgi:hypothetical protein